MIARSLSKTIVFNKPFLLKGVGRSLPAGEYRVVTDEELIEGISFPVPGRHHDLRAGAARGIIDRNGDG
jgi:hypothetical protein